MYKKKSFVNKLFDRVEAKWARTSSKRYVAYLRKKGCKIGDNIKIYGISTITIDASRPSLLEIGNNVMLNKGATLLTHDYVSGVFITCYNEFINSSGRIKIGNNVHLARNVTILKDVEIGDNCFIGYGSVVTKDIPANSIAIGMPAKVICSLDDYFEKRKVKRVEEALDYARSIVERYNRRPVVEDFWEEFPLFVSGDEVEKYPTIPFRIQLGDTYDYWVENHVKKYENLDAFLKAAGID